MKNRDAMRMAIAELADGELRDPIEKRLYGYNRRPSPNVIGAALGISGRHVKNLCNALGLAMSNEGTPKRQARWKIPLRTFRDLRAHLGRDAGEAPSARSVARVEQVDR